MRKLFTYHAAKVLGALALASLGMIAGVQAQVLGVAAVHNFTGADGSSPQGPLAWGTDGNIYGTTVRGGANNAGTIFQLTTGGVLTTLHVFSARSSVDGTNLDGAGPSGLILGTDGAFYGTTIAGGALDSGTVFKVTPAGVLTTLYSFSATRVDPVSNIPNTNSDGANPAAPLIQGGDGNFYGTTNYGGAGGAGTLFQITPAGVLTNLFDFDYGSGGGVNIDGGFQINALLRGIDGSFYGSTNAGGAGPTGTAFRFTPPGTFSLLSSFVPTDDNNANPGGAFPGVLAQNPGGVMFGTTVGGGANGNGTIFQVKQGVLSTVYDFGALVTARNGANADGVSPGELAWNSDDGYFYGVTRFGGTSGTGTLYRLTSGGVLTTLYNFSVVDGNGNSYEGSYPHAALLTGRQGTFYGVAAGGGTNNNGTIFKMAFLPVVTGPATAFGSVGDPFSCQVQATNTPDTYYAQGLPHGLAINKATGLITGSSVSEGTFPIVLKAFNVAGRAIGGMTLTVVKYVPVVTSSLTATGQDGSPFSYQITAAHGAVSYSVQGLPEGLSYDKITGLISGTPTTAGTFPVSLNAYNSFGKGSATLQLTMVKLPPVLTSPTTASGQDNIPFSYQITALYSPVSFSVQGLPEGLTANYKTGLITGKPTVGGVFPVTLNAYNSAGKGAETLTLTLVKIAPVVTGPLAESGVVGTPFSYQINALNSPVSYSVQNLPPGLRADDKTGLITGSPTVAGVFPVTLNAYNSVGKGTGTLTLTMRYPAPVVTSPATANGTVGDAFGYQTTATNYTSSYKALGLPAGLSMDGVSGLITGAPVSAGTFPVTLYAYNSGGKGTQLLTIQVVKIAPAITSALSGSNLVSSAFSYQITAAHGPVSYSAQGLPPGLSVDPASGLISGVPTAPGVFPVTLNAYNGAGKGSAVMSLNIGFRAPVLIGPTVAAGSVGDAFSYQIQAANNPASFAADGLPAGLTLDPLTGLIAGTPTQAGDSAVTLHAYNSAGRGFATLDLKIVKLAPVIAGALARNVQVNTPFSYQIVALHGPVSYSAQGLPAGLRVDAGTGLISGTPTATGLFPVALNAYNSVGQGTATLNLDVEFPPPVVTSAAVASGTVGDAFSYQLTGTNLPTSYKAIGLPAGLAIDAVSGLISGAPAAAGTFPVSLYAYNGGGKGTAPLTITIVKLVPVITSATTATDLVGTAFTYQITAAHGPTGYSVQGLPAGLSADSVTGLISGAPTVAGTFPLTLNAYNSAGKGSAAAQLIVQYGVPVVTSATTAGGTVGDPFVYQIVATNRPQSFTAGALPAGLSFDPASGLISGTPTNQGRSKVTLGAVNPSGTGSTALTIVITRIAPVITSGPTVTATVAQPFTYQIAASHGPVSFSVQGLPAGLSGNTATGLISGTPTAVGTSTVTYNAYNAAGQGTAVVQWTIRYLAPVVTSATAASGTVGDPFSYQIAADNHPTSYKAIGLPAGLTLDEASGLLTGSPAVAGTFPVSLYAYNSTGKGVGALTLTVVKIAPVITSATAASDLVGTAFSYQIAALHGPVSYSVQGLPAGLSADPTSGLITGTPTAAGTFPVTLNAYNSTGKGTAILQLAVQFPTPAVTSALTGSGTVGDPFAYQITATNEPTHYAATGLPAGLSLDPATGIIAGTLAQPGTFQIALSAANAVGTGTASLSLRVTRSAPVITSPVTAASLVNTAFSYQIAASHGPVSYSAQGLPAGLTANLTTGLITGTPTALGTYAVTLNAYNSTGKGTATLQLVIEVPAPAITSATSASATVGIAFSYQILATNQPTGYAASGLPAGLSLDPATGIISGTPATAGVSLITLSATNGTGTGTATLTLTTAKLVPVITSATAATASDGDPFSYQITATYAPVGYSVQGLPPGLTANNATGLISGTPTTPGTYPVTLNAYNSTGKGTATLTLTVVRIAPAITSATTASDLANTPFSYQITAVHAPASYSVQGLPAGLVADNASGLITGTPAVAGSYAVTLNAYNSGGKGTATLLLTVQAVPVVTSATTAAATVGDPFSYQIVAANYPTSYAASGLPAGLSVDPVSGLISGTPTTAGTSTVTLSATNVTGTGVASLTVTIEKIAPVVTSASTANAVLGEVFAYQITVANGPARYSVAKMPAGLTINGFTGLISGTPVTAGQYTLKLTATNSAGLGVASLLLTVEAPPVVTSATSASGQLSGPFSYQIAATGLPSSYAAKGLPAGLSVDPGTGLITGTPQVLGTFPVTLSATNFAGTGTAALSLKVTKAAPVITSATTATGIIGAAFSYQITVVDTAVSYSVQGLPAGLSVNTATGLISGTPQGVGTSTVTLNAYNSAGTGTATLSLLVEIPAPVLTSATTAGGVLGGPFSYQITASNSPTSYNVSGLPAGLSVDPVGGLITGTPQVLGTFPLTLNATNGTGTGVATLVLTIAKAAPVITSEATASGLVGTVFSYQVTVVNTAVSYSAQGLPAGLTMNAATGLISGVPTAAGVFNVTLNAYNSAGAGAAALTLTVLKIAPVITSATADSAVAGASYVYQITANYGPVSYSVQGLPAGLVVDNATGLISGVPAVAGVYTLTLNAYNGAGKGSETLVLTVGSD